ncbi:MAG: dihydrofolate reductase family protein [Propionibacteriaceae bacterium]
MVNVQATVDNRIANAEGGFWEPFPWGDPEQAYVNDVYRAADTIVLSRVMYEAIVPWWDLVAAGQVPADVPEVSPTFREFADILSGMRKVVMSRTWSGSEQLPVISGNVAAEVAALKNSAGEADILLACGPRTLGPLASVPGLVDEYLIAVHPAVLTDGPRLFDHVTTDLALELVEARPFEAGAVILRYRTAAS